METLVETITLPGLRLVLERPLEPDALVSDEAFGEEEFLPDRAELWPSGVALAEYVAAQNVQELRVLELGCGLGLPSLAAAAGGARVLATDWAEEAIELLRANAARSALGLEVARRDWREPDWLDPSAFDLVLAADVLYEKRNAAPLTALLDRMLATGARAWIADPGRRHAAGFFETVEERHRVRPIPHQALPGGGIWLVDDRS